MRLAVSAGSRSRPLGMTSTKKHSGNPARTERTSAHRHRVTVVRCETPWSWALCLDGRVHEQRIPTRERARAKARELRAALAALWAVGTDPDEVAALDAAQRICEARDAVCREEVRRHGRCLHCEVLA